MHEDYKEQKVNYKERLEEKLCSPNILMILKLYMEGVLGRLQCSSLDYWVLDICESHLLDFNFIQVVDFEYILQVLTS